MYFQHFAVIIIETKTTFPKNMCTLLYTHFYHVFFFFFVTCVPIFGTKLNQVRKKEYESENSIRSLVTNANIM